MCQHYFYRTFFLFLLLIVGTHELHDTSFVVPEGEMSDSSRKALFAFVASWRRPFAFGISRRLEYDVLRGRLSHESGLYMSCRDVGAETCFRAVVVLRSTIATDHEWRAWFGEGSELWDEWPDAEGSERVGMDGFLARGQEYCASAGWDTQGVRIECMEGDRETFEMLRTFEDVRMMERGSDDEARWLTQGMRWQRMTTEERKGRSVWCLPFATEAAVEVVE